MKSKRSIAVRVSDGAAEHRSPSAGVRPAAGLVTLLAAGACVMSDGGPTNPTEPEFAPLVISTPSLPPAIVGEAYSAGIDATGGSGEYTWAVVSGALPPGLALSVEDLADNDVVITGIPESAGTAQFGLRVQSEDGQRRTRTFTIQVLPEAAEIAIENAFLAPALVGAGYDVRLAASGGDGATFSWSVVGGELPAGLELSEAGRLQGTPVSADTAVVVLRVASGGHETEKAFTLVVVANRTGTFDLTPAPVLPIPTAIRPHVDAAFARWQDVISGDLGAASIPAGFFDPGECGGFGVALNGTSADDIIVLVNIVSIDGPGQVLGQAGPCVVRGNDLPFAGLLTLDADDLGALVGSQTLTDIITHEIGHVLGFGSLWDFVGGLVGGTEDDPRFIGSDAVGQWQALGGTGGVPLETEGGSGTAGSHWRESIFNRELMTGFSESVGVAQPLSRVTIASLADMGYAVDLNAADAFSFAPPMSPAAAARDRLEAIGYDVVYRGPVRRITDTDGAAGLPIEEPR